jgi:hypothetical protein
MDSTEPYPFEASLRIHVTVRLYSERPRSTQFTVQELYPNPL